MPQRTSKEFVERHVFPNVERNEDDRVIPLGLYRLLLVLNERIAQVPLEQTTREENMTVYLQELLPNNGHHVRGQRDCKTKNGDDDTT